MAGLLLRGTLTPKQTLTGKLSGANHLVGTLSMGYEYRYIYNTEGGGSSDLTFIESVPLPERTLENGVNSITLTHYKEGFGCFLLTVSPKRVNDRYYAKIKSIGVNTADVDIVNTGSDYTGSIGTAYWLCISLSAINVDSGDNPMEEDDVNAAGGSGEMVLDQSPLDLSLLA